MLTSEDISRVKRGPADLEERIDQLKKQKEILKSACKNAGLRIKGFEKEIDRLAEENDNLRTMLGNKDA